MGLCISAATAKAKADQMEAERSAEVAKPPASEQAELSSPAVLEMRPELVFPRPDAGGPSEETETEALRKGRRLYSLGNAGSRRSMMPMPTPNDIQSMGGKVGVCKLFGTHYRRMFQDPRMVVLFDVSQEDSNVTAATHGERLALALLGRWTGDRDYARTRGNLFANLEVAHQRAKHCPFRSQSLRGRGFTEDQRDSWLGHVWLAGEEVGVDAQLCDKLAIHLASAMDVYAPFVSSKEA
mmetsp:Transcript_62605/g.146925  ORF Transcript_62605/g.146925 Transcript_62605/m.146925 type:complete len:239 (+) Transcript_62605:49-765(+)